MLEKQLHEELKRFNAINRYGITMIMEQDVPPVDPTADPNAVPTDIPPVDPMGVAPTDVPTDAPMDVPPADPTMGGDEMESPEMDSTEEIDITDLVNMTKNIKNDLESNKIGRAHV